MENDAVTQIQARLAELPSDVRNAIQSADLGPTLQAIGAAHRLHIDKIEELSDETMLAMLGFTPLESFDTRLASVLGLSAEEGSALASEVSSKIFGPIRESMKKFAEERANPQGQAFPKSDLKPAPAPFAPPVVTPQKPPLSPELHEANKVLSQPTISVAPTPSQDTQNPAQKPIYKADPYREPV